MHTTGILGAYFREVVDGTPIITYAQDRRVLDMFTEEPFEGNTQKELIVESAIGTATWTGEGAPAPAPTWGTTRRGTLSYATLQSTKMITGEAITALQNGYRKGVEKIADEMIQEMAVALNAAAGAAILAAILNDAAIYGLNRVANNWLPAVQNAGAAALTENHLQTAYNALRVGTRRAPMDDVVILTTVPQQTRYTNLLGLTPTGTLPIVFNLQTSDGAYDVGRLKGLPAYNTRPMLDADAGMALGEVLFLHASMLRMIWKAPLKMEPLATRVYGEEYRAVAEVGFYYRDPGKAARITNLAL